MEFIIGERINWTRPYGRGKDPVTSHGEVIRVVKKKTSNIDKLVVILDENVYLSTIPVSQVTKESFNQQSTNNKKEHKMSPYIMMLVVLKIGEVVESVVIKLDVNNIPPEVDILDTESNEVSDYLKSLLPEALNGENSSIHTIEKVDHFIDAHPEAPPEKESEPYQESPPAPEAGSETIADSQRADFEGKIDKLKIASEKAKGYANGCIRSKGVCKPERIIEHLTIN